MQSTILEAPKPCGSVRGTCCRLNAQTGRFVTWSSKWDKASGTDFDDSSGDVLRLGAPSLNLNPLDYQWPPMVETFGLQVLNAGGFINGQVPPEYASGFNPKGRTHALHPSSPIHPLLRKDMWRGGLTDEDWDLIQPSLHIASALLDEPNVLRFFGSYFLGVKTAVLSSGERIILAKVPGYLNNEQFGRLWNTMVLMRRYLWWEFEEEENMDGAFGYTDPLENTNGMVPGKSSVCKITLTKVFLDVLRQQQDPAEYEEYLNDYQEWHNADPDRRIHIDGPSSRLRTIFLLAITILHELNHAVDRATGIYILRGDELVEPYFRGDRVPEVGFAFEKWLLNGEIESVLLPDGHDMELSIQAPYGWTMYPEPTSKGLVVKSAPRWELPIPAAWISSLFSRQFWEVSILRWGASELRCPLFWSWRAEDEDEDGDGNKKKLKVKDKDRDEKMLEDEDEDRDEDEDGAEYGPGFGHGVTEM